MRAFFGLGLAVAVLMLAVGCSKKDSTTGGGGGGRGGGGGVPPDGTYVIVALERSGAPAPAEKFTKESEHERTIRIAGDKLIATKGGKDDSVAVKWDPSQNPGHVTVTEIKPNGKTETTYGIYKMEGDNLIVCMVVSDKEEDRPKEFKTSKDSKATLMTLKKK